MPYKPPRGVDLPEDLAQPVPTDRPKLLKSFLAGVDPRGTITMDLGRRTDPKHYGKMQTLGTAGGLLGGGLVVPGIIGGLAALVPALLARKNPAAIWKAVRGGATDIYGKVWGALRASRALQRAGAGRRALTAAETKLVQNAVHRNVTIGDVFKKMRKHTGSGGAASAAQSPEAQNAMKMMQTGHKLSPEVVAPLVHALRKGYMTGGLAIGGAGGITSYSAYKQYNLGQAARKERQEAERRARAAYNRGMGSKYSSARLELVKRALEQYDPVPFSGLTAVSDYAANRKHAPKEPNPLTKDEQERLGVLYENSSKSSQRVVDAHRRGRTTLVA